MTLTLTKLKQDAAENPEKVFNSIGHLCGIDRKYQFSAPYLITPKKGRHFWLYNDSDKAEQRKILRLLNAVYEPLFSQLEISHGYRPKRSRHTAIERLKLIANQELSGGICLIKCDVEHCFDDIPHSALNSFLDRRITCGNVRKPIRRFLRNKAILNPKVYWKDCHQGVFPGSVLGPILSNIFLHYVLDQWFTDTFPEYGLVRYADDFMIILPAKFAGEAGGIVGNVSWRFLNFGMLMHESKTKIKTLGKGDDMEFLGFSLNEFFADSLGNK